MRSETLGLRWGRALKEATVVVVFVFSVLNIGVSTVGAETPQIFSYQVLPIEFKNLNSGLCMDVAGAYTDNGTVVQQYPCHAGKNQSWFLTPARDAFQIRVGHVGAMNLTVKNDSLQDNADIEIYNPRMAYSQVWKVNRNSDGTFEIRGHQSDKCLDVAGASNSSNAHVVQNSCNGGKSQKWVLRPRAKASSLIVKHSAKCLDIAGKNTADNANVQQYKCLDQDNQRWYIQGADTKGAYWYLVSPNGEKCLDVAGGSTQNGGNVQQYTCNNQDNQKWQVVSQGGDYFSIKNKKSKKCLDIAGAGLSDNANLQQYTCTGAANQLFRWAFFQERHVQLVQIGLDDGSNRATIPTLDIQTMVEYANELYRPHGLRLLFIPESDIIEVATDVAYLNNTGLYYLLGWPGTTLCPDTQGLTDVGICAQRYAKSQWPEKIVVYVRPGYGFSAGDANYIVLGKFRYGMQCSSGGDTGIPDKFWLAHELGHYLGVMHNQANVDQAVAESWLQAANDDIRVFDADFLPDTPPGVCWDWCAAPHDRVFNMTLNGANGPVTFPVDTDNALGYYYSENRVITGNQSQLMRATVFARWE